MKLIQELITFGRSGSRKSGALALGGVAVLSSEKLGFAIWQGIAFAALCGVFIIGRAWHDAALVKAGK